MMRDDDGSERDSKDRKEVDVSIIYNTIRLFMSGSFVLMVVSPLYN